MKISKDCYVEFHYRLYDSQKQELSHSYDAAPLPYLHGYKNIMPALESGLLGKSQGDKFVVSLSAEQAYGEVDDALVETVPASVFAEMKDLEVGSHCEMADDQGKTHVVKITAIEGDNITIDGNHPLAGQSISFDVEIMVVRQANDEELTRGHVN